jgi:hypothetical protein
MSQDAAGDGTGGLPVGAVAGMVLGVFMVCGVALYCRLPQCYKGRDDNDYEEEEPGLRKEGFANANEEEEGLGGTGEETATRTGFHVNEARYDIEIIKLTFERAQHFFPNNGMDFEYVANYNPGKFGSRLGITLPTDYIKASLREYVTKKMDAMGPEEKKILMKRENAQELCLKPGMNPEVVKVKVEANRRFQEELGLQFKTPILDAISHLINQLDYDNPFGEANKCIEVYEMQENLDSLECLCVEVNPRTLKDTICFIKGALVEKGYSHSFMHGTTATNLGKVVDAGRIMPSESIQGHDFGSGFYCFKGELEQALSYSFA